MSKSSRKRKATPLLHKKRTFRNWLIWSLVKMGIVVALIWTVVGLAFYAYALTFDLRTISEMPQRSAIYDYQGKYYSRLAGENRIVVPFDKVSNEFVNALLAREDTRFYYHHGIDPIGITRAILRNFVGGGFRQGASTITQQLARNSFPLGGKNMLRKLIEAALAYRIETELSKEEILEAYMNRIYFGSGYYGVETASQAYFGKPASRMNISEAATLAGLIRSPNRFSPFNNLEGAVRERNTVLKRMLQLDLITQEQHDKALLTELVPAPRPPSASQENWAMDTILHELELVIDQDPMDEGGLKIYTTIDGALQNAAEASVAKRLTQIEATPGYAHKTYKSTTPSDVAAEQDGTPYLQAAALAMDNKTGGIRAIVGGRDFLQSRFNRALLGRRQVGSAVKPFVYAKAFEAGLRPGDLIDDGHIRPGDLPRAYGRYDPSNSDNTYRGMLPASEGLVLSRNTMTVRIGYKAGFDKIAETIALAGIAKDPPRYPAICLGAFEASLKDLTAGYTVFPTGGTKLQPFIIDKILDADNNVLYRSTRGQLPILPQNATTMTTAIMEDVLTRGTGAKSRQYGLRHRAAGKTGTTNEYQDAWFIGFDDRLTCGVWVGFDRPSKIMTGGTGGELALPIWVDIVESTR